MRGWVKMNNPCVSDDSIDARVHTFDRLLEWREHRNALMDERASKATKSPIVGPLSDERSLMAAVKYVLRLVGCAISAPFIREMLGELGFPLAKYKGNPLLSIHPTLKRLVAKGCIREVPYEGQTHGWKEYEWIGPD
jgi:hypothetical protein